jgi:hypothetical protein
MRARIAWLSSFLLVLALGSLHGCCSVTCGAASGKDPDGDPLLRGHASFGNTKDTYYNLRLHLYGIDTVERPKGTLMQLREVTLFGKAGDVPLNQLGVKENLLGTVTWADLAGRHVGLGRARRQFWEAKPTEFDPDKLKVPKAKPQFTVLGRFRFSSSHAGSIQEVVLDRRIVIPFEKASDPQYLQVPAAGPGDVITKLLACGTFHAPQNQAIFDVTQLTYNPSPAGRIEIFAAAPGTDDLFVDAYRIYYRTGSTSSPFSVTGIVAPYDGSSTWRFGARITVSGTSSTSQGTFIDLDQHQGTATSVEE